MKKLALLALFAGMVSTSVFAQEKACCKKHDGKCTKESAACCKDKKNCSKDSKECKDKTATSNTKK